MQPATSTLSTADDETSGNILSEATDAPDQTPGVEPPAKLPAIDRVWNYFRKRFNEEDWFGSTILLSYIYRDYNNIRAARARLVNGEKKPDNIRAFNYASGIGVKSASFLSQRQGKIPEGDTYLQRLNNTLRHPGRSLPQFEYLAELPNVALGVYNNTQKGLKAHGIGLASGETRYAAEKVRLYESILSVASTLLSGHGLFRKKRETLQGIKEEADLSEVKGTIRKIWRYDRTLLAGSALSTAAPVLSAIEAWSKSNKSRKEAFFLLRATAVGMAAEAAYYFYVFQRIVKSNFGEKKENITQTQEELPTKQPKGFIDKTWEYLKSRFTRDNFYGSLVIPLTLREPLRNLNTAQNRTVNGIPSPDKARILSNRLYIAERSWSFFSARGAKFPEGFDLQRRVINTLKHPQRSSAQFEYLMLLPSRLLTTYAHTKAGLAAYGIGGQIYKREQKRLYVGMLQALWISFLGYGHFRKREQAVIKSLPEETPDGALVNEEKNVASTQQSMSMLDIMRKIWKHDRILAFGYILDALFPISSAHTRWQYSEKTRADAVHLAKEAASIILTESAYGLYTFQRIARSNFNGTLPSASSAMPGLSEQNATKLQQDNHGEKVTFTQKITFNRNAPILDKRLIHSWSSNIKSEELTHGDAPYLSHFRKGGEELLYISAQHPKNARGVNPTFSLIDYTFETSKPDLLIIEGLPGTDFKKEAETHVRDDFAEGNERAYAVSKAVQEGIPFISGEATDSQLFTYMNEHGFSNKEVMALFVLRIIPQWREQEGVNEGNFNQTMQAFVSDDKLFGFIPKEQRLTPDEFKAWYMLHNDKPGQSFLQRTRDDLEKASNSPDAPYFDKIFITLSKIRDQHLADVIQNSLQDHKKVAVIYGLGHLAALHDTFEAAFGKPDYTTLNDISRSSNSHAATLLAERAASEKLTSPIHKELTC